MSCGHMASGVRNVLGDGSAFGVSLRYVEEPRPLGTGGALKYAESLLDERFLMLNGDVLTDIDLSAPARPARADRRDARRSRSTPVEDPSDYGLVRTAGDGAVTEFVEKPALRPDRHAQHLGRRLRARARGARPARARPARLDRARRLPAARRQRPLRLRAENYWLDIGTPERYLEATFDILEGTVGTAFAERAGDGYLVRRADASRTAGGSSRRRSSRAAAGSRDGARVGGRVVLETGVMVGANTTIERAVVMRGAEIGENCTLSGCIVGGGVRIGDNTHVEGLSVLGEGVTIGADNVIANGARIFPGVELPDGAIRF